MTLPKIENTEKAFDALKKSGGGRMLVTNGVVRGVMFDPEVRRILVTFKNKMDEENTFKALAFAARREIGPLALVKKSKEYGIEVYPNGNEPTALRDPITFGGEGAEAPMAYREEMLRLLKHVVFPS
ncbi:Uncharacterised protein [Candidatus Norongarragalina meridionalis]|nr:Uncharacterised protein [Candidatus Norongarragalina meridionalis]